MWSASDFDPNRPEVDDFICDEKAAPVIVVTYPTVSSVVMIERLFAQLRECARRHHHVAWVFDMTRFNPLTSAPTSRRSFALEFERSRDVLTPATICLARVSGSLLVRSIIAGVDVMARNPYKTDTFGDLQSACAWARSMVQETTGL
jgi:hypothetical protein